MHVLLCKGEGEGYSVQIEYSSGISAGVSHFSISVAGVDSITNFRYRCFLLI